MTTTENTLNTITAFINNIGICCEKGIVKNDSFLPGVDIVHGKIIYEEAFLLSPGDLLHEAGHIAILKPEYRQTVTSPDVNGDMDEGAAEMAAIGWSWAALCHLQINPEIVFHDKGYKGGGDSIIDNFINGRYLGVPILQWIGMTTELKNSTVAGEPVYPGMKYWLRP